MAVARREKWKAPPPIRPRHIEQAEAQPISSHPKRFALRKVARNVLRRAATPGVRAPAAAGSHRSPDRGDPRPVRTAGDRAWQRRNPPYCGRTPVKDGRIDAGASGAARGGPASCFSFAHAGGGRLELRLRPAAAAATTGAIIRCGFSAARESACWSAIASAAGPAARAADSWCTIAIGATNRIFWSPYASVAMLAFIAR